MPFGIVYIQFNIQNSIFNYGISEMHTDPFSCSIMYLQILWFSPEMEYLINIDLPPWYRSENLQHPVFNRPIFSLHRVLLIYQVPLYCPFSWDVIFTFSNWKYYDINYNNPNLTTAKYAISSSKRHITIRLQITWGPQSRLVTIHMYIYHKLCTERKMLS